MNYLRRLRPAHLHETILKKGVLAANREIILQNLFNIILIAVTIGMPVFMLGSPQVFRSGDFPAYMLGYLVFVVIAIVRRINYYFRAAVIVIMLQALGTAALLSYGLSGTGITFIFASILIANLVFGPALGFTFDVTGVIPVALIGFLMVTGRYPLPPLSIMANSNNPVQWITAGTVMVFAVALTTGSILVVLRGLNNALLQREKLTEDLEAERASLERRVEERSAALKKRVDQFAIASMIARDISGETNLEGLLNTAVNMIRDQFGFYHVGVYLNDDERVIGRGAPASVRSQFTVLKAATGEAGRMMLERGHRLKIGEISMVGYVTGQGEARISSDVLSDVIYNKNPLLPETRSEMALPLRTHEHTIGALDVQSAVPDAFSSEDVRILQTIADQLSIAFEKTRLVEELQRSVDELEASYRTTTQKAWHAHLRNTRQKLAYRYHDERLENQVDESEHAREALAKGQPVYRVVSGVSPGFSQGIQDEQGRPVTNASLRDAGLKRAALAIPIKLRNQVLGVVDIHFQTANVSPELISLIEGTVNRLAVSLENARLLEEIQYRAERERLVSEISTKVRAAADVDTVLRTAIQEIGRSLGVSEVMIQLRKES